MDTNGTLYLYRSSLLCVNDIIKRLTEGTYQLGEPRMLGKLEKTCNQLLKKYDSSICLIGKPYFIVHYNYFQLGFNYYFLIRFISTKRALSTE